MQERVTCKAATTGRGLSARRTTRTRVPRPLVAALQEMALATLHPLPPRGITISTVLGQAGRYAGQFPSAVPSLLPAAAAQYTLGTESVQPTIGLRGP